MSTPRAIRFLNKNNEPFCGVFLHYDSSLENVVDNILEANRRIVIFPIQLLHGDDRVEARKEAEKIKGIEQKELKFVKDINDYSLAFIAALYKSYDVYSAWYKHTDDEFSGVEGEISMLDLKSQYKGNIVYCVDIHIPKINELNLSNLSNEPIVKITSGVGEVVFEGNITQLKEKQSLLK